LCGAGPASRFPEKRQVLGLGAETPDRRHMRCCGCSSSWGTLGFAHAWASPMWQHTPKRCLAIPKVPLQTAACDKSLTDPYRQERAGIGARIVRRAATPGRRGSNPPRLHYVPVQTDGIAICRSPRFTSRGLAKGNEKQCTIHARTRRKPRAQRCTQAAKPILVERKREARIGRRRRCGSVHIQGAAPARLLAPWR
jgi:hypothetical protein